MTIRRKFALQLFLFVPLLIVVLLTAVSWFLDLNGDAPNTEERYNAAVAICDEPRTSDYFQSRIVERQEAMERANPDMVEELSEYLELSVAAGACADASLQYFYALEHETPRWMWSRHRLQRAVSSCFVYFGDANARESARYLNLPRTLAAGQLEPVHYAELEAETLKWMKRRPNWMWFAGNICP